MTISTPRIAATPAGAPDRPRRSVTSQVGIRSRLGEEPRVERQAQLAVDDDPHRRAVGRAPAGGRSAADRRRATVPVPTRTASCVARSRCARSRAGGAGDPAALAARGGDAAVERGGELQRDQRPAVLHAAGRKPALSSAASAGAEPGLDLDAGRAQPREPAAGRRADRDPRARPRRARRRRRSARRRRAASCPNGSRARG